MTVDLDVPAGTEGELAARIASLDEVTYAGLGPEERDRYLVIARWFIEYLGDDDFHWGCTSSEAAEERENDSWDSGWEQGFAKAQERVIAGIETLVDRSMVEAELAVEVIPRVRAMTAWDEDQPRGHGDGGSNVVEIAAKHPNVQA